MPHLDAIYNYARWLTRSQQDADDIAQETMLRALQYFDSARGDNIRAWLFTIARNNCNTCFKRKGIEGPAAAGDASLMDTPAEGPDPQDVLISKHDAQAMRGAIEKLPIEYREVLILREMEDLSYKEIAAVTECPIGTVMSRLARARTKLAGDLRGADAKGEGL